MNNGKSIYYFTANNKSMAVNVNEKGSTLSPDKPYTIFDPGSERISMLYDINKAGNEIIAAVPSGKNNNSNITFVDNWQKEVEGKK